METLALPLEIDSERVGHHGAPPMLGAHSADVLAELGYSAAEVDELAAAGVTRLA
jgi:crotonobetainyl-CoA:carnitine CoA-transferase CaiB-like acyl-CoA transferase